MNENELETKNVPIMLWATAKLVVVVAIQPTFEYWVLKNWREPDGFCRGPRPIPEPQAPNCQPIHAKSTEK
jgi:hypothetical protein